MAGGDIDRNAIAEAFSKIKEDILRLNNEIYELKKEQKKNSGKQEIDPELIKQIVKETLKNLPQRKESPLVRKINKKRKSLLTSRILSLAEKKNMTLPEIKDIIVDSENLCSKATFYRYMDKLKARGVIEIAVLGETEIVVKN